MKAVSKRSVYQQAAKLGRNIGLESVIDSPRLRLMLGAPLYKRHRVALELSDSEPGSPKKKASKASQNGKGGAYKAAVQHVRSIDPSLPLWRRLEELESVLPILEGEIWFQRRLFHAYRWMEKWELAAEAGEKVTRDKSAKPLDFFRTGYVYGCMGEDTARDKFMKLALSKSSAEIRSVGLGHFYEKEGLFSEAAEQYREFTLTKRSTKALDLWISSACRAFDYDSALEAAQFGLKLTESPKYLLTCADVYERRGEYDAAANSYLNAYRHGQQRAVSLQRATYCLACAEHWDQAVPVLVESLRGELLQLWRSDVYRDRIETLFAESGFSCDREGASGQDQSLNASDNDEQGKTRDSKTEIKESNDEEIIVGKLFDENDVFGLTQFINDGDYDLSFNHAALLFTPTYNRAKEALQSGDLSQAIDLFEKCRFLAKGFVKGTYRHLAIAYLLKGDSTRAVSNLVLSTEFFDPDQKIATAKKRSEYDKKFERYLEVRDFAPLDEKTILFESHIARTVDCNPLAMYREICSRNEFADWSFIWVANDIGRVPEDVLSDERVTIVSRQTYGYWEALATVKYLVNNVTFTDQYIRRDGQVYMNTWHGTPLKTIGQDIKDGVIEHANFARNLMQCTHLINPNEFTENIILDHCGARGLITAMAKITGYPRNDILFDPDRREIVRRELGITSDESLVFYAPTWRGTLGEFAFDVDELKNQLSVMAESGAKVAFRGHLLSEELLKGTKLDALVPDPRLSTYDLICAADVVVTDYSSLGVDAFGAGKPVIWFTYDLECYSETRGLYLQENDFPGFVVQTDEELKLAIEAVLNGEDFDAAAKNAALARFAPCDDGGATKRAVDFLFEPFHPVDRRDKTNLLVHHSFIPNGITSSVLNLLNSLSRDAYNVTVLGEMRLAKSDDRILDELDKLVMPVNIQARTSVGIRTFLEQEAHALHKRINGFSSPWHREIIDQMWSRESARLVGGAIFDHVIEYEGYSDDWAGIFSQIDVQGNRGFYLHNDMRGESERRFPWLKGVHSYLNKYQKLISVSPGIIEDNIEFIQKFNAGVSAESFSVMGNLIRPDFIRQRSTEEMPDELSEWMGRDRLNLVVVARLSTEKAQERIIEATANLVSEGYDLGVLLLGAGPLEDDYKALVDELNVRENVLVYGFVENPFPMVKAADFTVLTSHYEGQGMVLLEAFALGTSALATHSDAVSEVISNGGGVVCRPTIEDLTELLRQAIESSLPDYREFDLEGYLRENLSRFTHDFFPPVVNSDRK